MAAQSLLRTCNFISKSIFNNRPSHIIVQNSVAGIKTDLLERLKQLQIPEKPKKPIPPYFQFISEQRATLLNRNPSLKQAEIVKHCANEWKNISEDIKIKYTEGYKMKVDEYNKEILSYNSKLSEEQKDALKAVEQAKRKDRKKRKIRKVLKEFNKPKRPLSPYILFIVEQSKIRNVSLKDLMTNSKEEWKNLKGEEKQKYIEQFAKEKEKYDLAKKEWEQKIIAEGHEEIVHLQNDYPRIKQKKKNTTKVTKDEVIEDDR